MYSRDHVGKCPTGKLKYDSLQRAKAALVGAVISRNYGKNHRKEIRIYECSTCGHWHLTSERKTDYDTKRQGFMSVLQVTAADDSTGSEGAPSLSGAG